MITRHSVTAHYQSKHGKCVSCLCFYVKQRELLTSPQTRRCVRKLYDSLLYQTMTLQTAFVPPKETSDRLLRQHHDLMIYNNRALLRSEYFITATILLSLSSLLLLVNGGLQTTFRRIPPPTVQECVTSCHFKCARILILPIIIIIIIHRSDEGSK